MPGWINDLCWWATDYFGDKAYVDSINANRKQLRVPDIHHVMAYMVENPIVVADPNLVYMTVCKKF